MPFWNNQTEGGVFGQGPDTSAIQLHANGKESTAWPLEAVAPGAQQPHENLSKPSALISKDGSLLDFYDLSKSLDDFTFDAPESPPSSSSDDDSSSDRDSSPSLPDLSPHRSFTLLTLDSDNEKTTSAAARPWEKYLPKTTPPHLRAFRLSSRRPKSTRTQQQSKLTPPKLLITHEPQLLDPVDTGSGLNINYDTSFLLPSPLSPCMPANFPRAPQNSPDMAYFPPPLTSPAPNSNSSTVSAPIPIPPPKDQQQLAVQQSEVEPEIVTTTCRKTPYYPPNSSQTEDRSRIYMNRGPHYIANWTPLSSLPIDAQRRIERNMVKFTAPVGKEEPESSA